jgi:hypothetical protein
MRPLIVESLVNYHATPRSIKHGVIRKHMQHLLRGLQFTAAQRSVRSCSGVPSQPEQHGFHEAHSVGGSPGHPGHGSHCTACRCRPDNQVATFSASSPVHHSSLVKLSSFRFSSTSTRYGFPRSPFRTDWFSFLFSSSLLLHLLMLRLHHVQIESNSQGILGK